MSFNDTLISDNATFFALFGEEITYTPKGGTAKTITAIVNRNLSAPIPGSHNGTYNKLEVIVSTGDVPTVIRDGDRVTISPIIGQTPVVMTVREITAQDVAQWRLGVS